MAKNDNNTGEDPHENLLIALRVYRSQIERLDQPETVDFFIDQKYFENLAFMLNVGAYDPKSSGVVLEAVTLINQTVEKCSKYSQFLKLQKSETLMRSLARISEVGAFRMSTNVEDRRTFEIPGEILSLAKETLNLVDAGLRAGEKKKMAKNAPLALAPSSSSLTGIAYIKDKKSKMTDKMETHQGDGDGPSKPLLSNKITKGRGGQSRSVAKNEKKSRKKRGTGALVTFMVDGLTPETEEEATKAFLALRGQGIMSVVNNVERAYSKIWYRKEDLCPRDLARALRENSTSGLRVYATLSVVEDPETKDRSERCTNYINTDESEHEDGQAGVFLDSEEVTMMEDPQQNDQQINVGRPGGWRIWGDGGFLQYAVDSFQRSYYW